MTICEALFILVLIISVTLIADGIDTLEFMHDKRYTQKKSYEDFDSNRDLYLSEADYITFGMINYRFKYLTDEELNKLSQIE